MSDRDDNPNEFTDIELLVISPAQETAQSVQTLLRDAGHNVHVTWLDKPEDLGDELQRQIPQLICCEGSSDAAGLNRLIALCTNIARGIPVVAVANALVPERIVELLNMGAAQVVALEQPDLLTRSIERELEYVDLRTTVKLSRRQISALKKQLGLIVAESPEAMAYVHEGIHTNLNTAYAKLFGFEDPNELEGVPLMDLITPESRDKIKALLASTRKKEGSSQMLPFVAQRADDSHVSLNMRCRAANMGGEEQIEVLITRNAPAQVAPPPANAFEGRVALYQVLTDLKNLRLKERSVGLLYILVDSLEKLQDLQGLVATDNILNELAIFLLDQSGADDQTFRFDVGEFVVLASGETAQDITATAERIRSAIDAEIFGDDKASTPLTVTIAMVQLHEEEANVTNLLKSIRLAEKTSRHEGNQVVLLNNENPKLSSSEADRLWLDRIKSSLEKNRFALAYQSIASLEGGGGELYDVQLRMRGDQGETIRPGEFLPTAERHGLMDLIDQWVMRQVLLIMKEQLGGNKRGMMFIKLSKAAIDSSETFLPWLKTTLDDLQVPASELAVAFDEETLQFNTKKATKVVNTLHDLGIKLAIHNFGAGRNSLQLLDLVPASFVKLDPMFTEALVSPEDNKRFSETLSIAQSKNIKIIASQVEDANSMARLWQSGVNYVQGYFVQEPESVARQSDLHVA